MEKNDPADAPAHGATSVTGEELVLYDGVCALCNNLVRFLISIDRSGQLYFAPLQGETAQTVFERHPNLTSDPSDSRTIIYVRNFGDEDETVSLRSEAVADVFGDLGGFWWLIGQFRWIPRPIRDGVYRFVASNRYDWFGQYDECPLPPPEVRSRFLP